MRGAVIANTNAVFVIVIVIVIAITTIAIIVGKQFQMMRRFSIRF